MPSRWDTAKNILNDAAVELGLISSDLADPYASVDPNIVQLRRLLKSAGQDLVKEYDWSHLTGEHHFDTVAGIENYDLPVDFAHIIDQTEFNRTARLAVPGSVTPQTWQLIKAMISTGAVFKRFRIAVDAFIIDPVPTAAESMYFEYFSRWWVRPYVATKASLDFAGLTATPMATVVQALAPGVGGNSIRVTMVFAAQGPGVLVGYNGNDYSISVKNSGALRASDVEAAITAGAALISVKTADAANPVLSVANDPFGATFLTGGSGLSALPSSDEPVASNDILWFDRNLLVARLKLDWRGNKGFDTSKVQRDYDAALLKAMGADGAAPVLSLNHSEEERMLNGRNIPDTGYGN